MIKQYSKAEEIVHSITHGIGAILGIIGMTVLLVLSAQKGSLLHVICYLVYGLSLIFLYLCSTLYHAIPFPRAKKIFKTLDHVGIYFLIAGTYTPILLLNLSGNLGIGLLLLIWSMAAAGTVFKFFFTGRFTNISALMYVLMGWTALLAFKPISEAIGERATQFIIVGGVTYTLGVIFYLMKKVPFHHAVWHLFVLAGSVIHFLGIFHASSF